VFCKLDFYEDLDTTTAWCILSHLCLGDGGGGGGGRRQEVVSRICGQVKGTIL